MSDSVRPYGLPVSVHGVLQARILEWVAMAFSRGSSWPRDRIRISHLSALAGGFFTTNAKITWTVFKLLEMRGPHPMDLILSFPGGSVGKESTCNVGDLGLIPGLGKSPREGNGNPLQNSCLREFHGQRRLVSYRPWDHRVGHNWVTNFHFHFSS